MQNISVPLHLTFVNVCNLCIKQIGQGSKFGIITACRFLDAKTYTDGAINNYNNIITDCYIYMSTGLSFPSESVQILFINEATG